MGLDRTRTGRLSAEETLELWQAYKDSGDPRLRDRLVLTFAPMVKYIVYRKVREIPARCEVEDFISCGLEALIRSIDRYDPEKGGTLEQFAWIRIHGAVLDELRRNDWAPRSLRRWERDINRAREQFVSLYGRPPSKIELSEAIGITVDDLNTRQAELARSDVGSLNTVVLSEDDTTIERIDTLPSRDTESDPEAAAMRERAKDQLPHGLRPAPRARSQGGSPALRAQPDPPRDRRHPRRHREPRLPDPRPAQAQSARAAPGRRATAQRSRLTDLRDPAESGAFGSAERDRDGRTMNVGRSGRRTGGQADDEAPWCGNARAIEPPGSAQYAVDENADPRLASGLGVNSSTKLPKPVPCGLALGLDPNYWGNRPQPTTEP